MVLEMKLDLLNMDTVGNVTVAGLSSVRSVPWEYCKSFIVREIAFICRVYESLADYNSK